MSKHRGKQQRSRGGNAGGRGGGGGGGRGNKQGKILYDSGEEPSFIRQFKERTGYQAPSTAEDKKRMLHDDERTGDADHRRDDEKPQIVQLNATDLSKEEVDVELAKVKEAEEQRQCIDPSGRLLFRKPKEKAEESKASSSKSDIIDMASNKTIKRKTVTSHDDQSKMDETKKKTKPQLLSFMDESGFDGDD